ncbi:MAG TPA: TonB family protein [Opitutaceae bacterium]
MAPKENKGDDQRRSEWRSLNSVNRYLLPAFAILTLMLSGCATGSVSAVRKPKEPFPGQITISGDYDKPPRMRFMPRTVFPPFLIERGESGSATIVFTLTTEGYVTEAKVESATHPAFGASALGTVGRMVFHPATKAGAATSVVGRVTFPFEFE